MPLKKSSQQEIIETLKAGNFYAECSECKGEIQLRRASLFDNNNFNNEALGIYNAQLEFIRQEKTRLRTLKERGTTRSEVGALSTNFGFIIERIAPTLPTFRFKHNDCRSLFDPIDYLIFEGLTQTGVVNKIYFVDIKTGESKLNKKQKEIKNVIENKKVKFKKF